MSMSMSMKKARITITIDPDLLVQIRKQAVQQDRSVSYICNKRLSRPPRK